MGETYFKILSNKGLLSKIQRTFNIQQEENKQSN